MSDQNCGMPDNCICGRCEIKVEHFDEPSPVDYEAKIKSLQAEIAELKQTGIKLASQVVDRDDEIAELKKPQWVSVEDRLPELDFPVLLLTEVDGAITGWRDLGDTEFSEYRWTIGNSNFMWGETYNLNDLEITHWMPLPPPPEAE